MHAYIPTKEELTTIVEAAVKRAVLDELPQVIRKATRKKWLTTEEVINLLQCSRRHVQYLRDSGQLLYSKNGRKIRYDIDDIEAFLDDHKA